MWNYPLLLYTENIYSVRRDNSTKNVYLQPQDY